jgi:AAA family ATP:ADP antiporter
MPVARDPFPMSSPEAQRLSASDELQRQREQNKDAWHTMGMTAQDAGPKTSSYAEDAAREGLTGKKKGKKKHHSGGGDNEDDIYSDDNDDDVNDDDESQDDEFLDHPMWQSRGTTAERTLVRVLRALEKLYRRLYGDKLPPSEMLRTLSLSMTLFFMIGGYWLLRSLKDPILTALCGVTAIPKAKMLSVFVVLAVVSVYNFFIDSDIPKHKLFYIFGTFYFIVFIVISLLLMHPTIGLENQQPNPYRILGWVSYCAIESFGSVMVSLFWSFANSSFSLETAKASYGVMVATAQVGSILGPTVVNRYAESWGPANCYLVGAVCMLLLQGSMFLYIRNYGTAEQNAAAPGDDSWKRTSHTTFVEDLVRLYRESRGGGDNSAANNNESNNNNESSTPIKKKEKAGILEGLYLFWEHNYVKGIFAISCLFMVEVTIVDFTMKVLARDYFDTEHPCEYGMSCYSANPGEMGMSKDATAAFTAFMGFFGQATNTLSLLLSAFGTSALIRYFGLRLALLLFPTLCLLVIICVRLRPTLYVVFGAMMMLKASSYALNNPTKEMLYQPTSSAVRYKAKSWIDIFGARGSKALGSVVTNTFSDSAANLVANGSLVGIAVASFLIWNARFMGKTFEEYTESGYIVGEDHSELVESEEKNVEMASSQNEMEDTSCGIDDDAELGRDEEGQGTEGSEADDDDDDDDDDDQAKPQMTMV